MFALTLLEYEKPGLLLSLPHGDPISKLLPRLLPRLSVRLLGSSFPSICWPSPLHTRTLCLFLRDLWHSKLRLWLILSAFWNLMLVLDLWLILRDVHLVLLQLWSLGYWLILFEFFFVHFD